MWHQLTAWLSSLPGGLSALVVSAVIVLWVIGAYHLAIRIGGFIARKDRERESAARLERELAATLRRMAERQDRRVLTERVAADCARRRDPTIPQWFREDFNKTWGRGGVSQSGTGSARRRSDHHAPHEESGMRTTRLSLNPKDAA